MSYSATLIAYYNQKVNLILEVINEIVNATKYKHLNDYSISTVLCNSECCISWATSLDESSDVKTVNLLSDGHLVVVDGVRVCDLIDLHQIDVNDAQPALTYQDLSAICKKLVYWEALKFGVGLERILRWRVFLDHIDNSEQLLEV